MSLQKRSWLGERSCWEAPASSPYSVSPSSLCTNSPRQAWHSPRLLELWCLLLSRSPFQGESVELHTWRCLLMSLRMWRAGQRPCLVDTQYPPVIKKETKALGDQRICLGQWFPTHLTLGSPGALLQTPTHWLCLRSAPSESLKMKKHTAGVSEAHPSSRWLQYSANLGSHWLMQTQLVGKIAKPLSFNSQARRNGVAYL